MRAVRSISSPVVALFVADIHLCMKPPLARAEESSWFGAMERSLSVLRKLREKYSVPVFCAGDVFDTWKVPPELINWAIERLPPLWAIPGNHDLPGHRPELVYRSPYGTLVRAKKINELGGWPCFFDRKVKGLGPLAVYGRPFGEEVPSLVDHVYSDTLNILVTHEFIWSKGTGHQGASSSTHVRKASRKFRDFDLVIVGDNHIPFEYESKGTTVVNCGGFFRRRSNERDHRPRIGILRASGAVSFAPIPIEEEKISRVDPEKESEEEEEKDLELEGLVKSLSKLRSSSLDFRENLQRVMKDRSTRKEVQEVILDAMDRG